MRELYEMGLNVKTASCCGCSWYVSQGHHCRRGPYSSYFSDKKFTVEQLLTDKGYDYDAIIEQASKQGMKVVILPKLLGNITKSFTN
jgi:hypothetical protein